MSSDQVLETAVKGFISIGSLVFGLIFFGPKISARYGIDIPLLSPSSTNSQDHQVALNMEYDHIKLDVLNIRNSGESIILTMASIDPENWTEDDLRKMNDVTFYVVELAEEEELNLIAQLYIETEAVDTDGELVDVYVHFQTLLCPWSVLESYDGTNSNELVTNCPSIKGEGINVDANEVAWAGRMN